MARVHPSAVVDERCVLADDVEIGPLCVVEGRVTLGPGVRLIAQVHLRGPLVVGAGCVFYPFSSAGLPAQHTGIDHDQEMAGVVIGEGCVFRESSTVHASMGTEHPTVLGDAIYMMACSHVGHDCIIKDHVILANSAVIGGHAEIGERVFISGNCSVHQWCRVGRGVMMQGGSQTSTDVPPYGIIVDTNVMAGLNLVGMRRGGVSREEITLVREAYRKAFKSGVTRPEMIEILSEIGQQSSIVAEMAEFVRSAKKPIAAGDGSLRSHHIPWLKRVLKAQAEAIRGGGSVEGVLAGSGGAGDDEGGG
jgi:UDP-N-acetylglucosamine acyltransferase